jgi:hypothetical protein
MVKTNTKCVLMHKQFKLMILVNTFLILLLAGSGGLVQAGTYELSLQWGSRGSSDGQFNSICGVAVDGSDNVYVVSGGVFEQQSDNCGIQKFSSSGTFIAKWGSFGSGDGQFKSPYGVDIDGDGNVYVAEFGSSRVQKLSSNGTFLTMWGSYGSENGQFKNPKGIAVDSSGNVYVADAYNDRVQKFTLSLTPTPSPPNFGPTSTPTPAPTPTSTPTPTQTSHHTTSPTPNPTSQPTQLPNSSPAPTPTVPELSWLSIVPLLLFMFSFAVVIRRRKGQHE